MGEWDAAGLGPFGQFLNIHSNAAGFFDTQAYSQWVLHEVVVPFAAGLKNDKRALMLHDSAPTHEGQMRPKGADADKHFRFDCAWKPMETRYWLKSMRIVEAEVLP